jgi:hypothetical protein
LLYAVYPIFRLNYSIERDLAKKIMFEKREVGGVGKVEE